MAKPVMQPDSQDARPLDIELSQMAALVEKQLAAAIEAFERRDVASAETIVDADKRIDDAHAVIEQKVMNALASVGDHPRELREIIMTMKVSGELERVGDLAKNVAKRTLVVSREAYARPSMGVTRMGRAALRQFSDMLNAFHGKNLEAAVVVWGGDDEIDELYNSVFQEIILDMMEDAARINACTHLVFIAKNFERVGDHATNIAEALHFCLTGTPLALDRPKGDETSTTAVTPRDRTGSGLDADEGED